MQRILLRRKLTIIELLQLPTLFVFSVFIDFWMYASTFLITDNYYGQLALCLSGSAILGFGISLQIIANVSVLPGEALNIVIAYIFKKSFSRIKILFDCGYVLLSVILSLLVLHEIVDVREGTILSALSVGFFVKHSIPITRRIKPFLWNREKRLHAAKRHKGCCKA